MPIASHDVRTEARLIYKDVGDKNLHDEVRLEYCRVLYRLLKERSENESLYHTGMPTWSQHVFYVKHHNYRAWHLIAMKKNPDVFIGAMTLTWLNEIGIAIFKKYRHRGYAMTALKWLLNKYTPWSILPNAKGHFVANIKPGNRVSLDLFKSLGFATSHICLVR